MHRMVLFQYLYSNGNTCGVVITKEVIVEDTDECPNFKQVDKASCALASTTIAGWYLIAGKIHRHGGQKLHVKYLSYKTY